MEQLTHQIEFSLHYYIPYSLDMLEGKPYLLYFLEKKHGFHFLQDESRIPPDSIFRGAINFQGASYLFYEVLSVEIEFLSTEKEDLWRVTPYEILYTRYVTHFPVHHSCVDLFKNFPGLCFVHDVEVPVVAYLGLGSSEIKEQILLQSKNKKNGIFGEGYYFSDYTQAEHDALFKRDDFLIRLDNIGLNDKNVTDTEVVLKNERFYYHERDIGDGNGCSPTNYVIYYYDEESVYLKSKSSHHCKVDIQKRKEDGYVMRYLLFLNKNSHVKRKGYDSYAYDSTYMLVSSDSILCLSYHLIKKNKSILHGDA